MSLALISFVLGVFGLYLYSGADSGGVIAFLNRFFFAGDKWVFVSLPLLIFAQKIISLPAVKPLHPILIVLLFALLTGVGIKSISIAIIFPAIIFGFALFYKKLKKEHVYVLLFPFFLLTMFASGWFHPVIVSLLALICALIIQLVVYRSLKFVDVVKLIPNTLEIYSPLFLILIFSMSIHQWLNFHQSTTAVIQVLSPWIATATGFLFFSGVLSLILGWVMDAEVAVMIFAPILSSLAVSYGVNPVHFGVVMLFSMSIAQFKPTKKNDVPQIGLFLGLLGLLILFPRISLFLID